MNRIISNILVAIALLATPVAWAADDRPVTLELTTLDDDLRAGGDVRVLLKMFDGTVQRTSANRGQRWADNSTQRVPVSPKSPYQWTDVTEFGLDVRLHAGDGQLQQPDKWKVRVLLKGTGGNCEARHLRPGTACFGERMQDFHFDRAMTQMWPIRAAIKRCSGDLDCNGGNFCGMQVARCAAGERGANPVGCLRFPTPKAACGGGACDESADRCDMACATPDKDGDGERSIECGGADCDDNDRNRAPARTEVCDERDVDEDCNPTTFGDRDLDRDGYIDANCKNISR